MRSELCIATLEGEVEVLMTHEGLIEAPNWHPDGYLIVNGGGRIYRVPLERPDLAVTRGDVRFMFSLTARLFPWRY